MSEPALEVENLEYWHMEGRSFHDVSFRLEMGQGGLVWAEHHRSARTLLRVCGTLVRPSRGRISWFGRSVSELHGEKELLSLKRDVGLVHRQTRLISNMSILDNLMLGLLYHRDLTPKEALDQVRDLLERFGLYHQSHLRPAELAYEKERLAVYARELIKKPRLFLLEIPPLDLGRENHNLVMNEIYASTRNMECAFLISSVTPEEGRKWVDWMLMINLEGGRVWPKDEFDSARAFRVKD